jgi:adenine-specific DNA methylase
LNHFDENYQKAVVTYLGILLDRIAIINTSFGRYHIGKESLEHPFSKQAIPMIFDFPESFMFCNSTGSALNQLDWLTRYIESECEYLFSVELKNASSGDKSQFPDKYLTAVVTDPPYYDAIAYADLSDFFYVAQTHFRRYISA